MPIAFSRSGRSGAHGKNDQRVSADVSLSLLADIGDAVEMFREATPTATRSEVIRSILDEALIVPLHDDDRPCRMRERAQALELTPYNPAPSRPAWRDARDMETCPLWVAALIAVGVGGGALLALAGAGWLIWESGVRIGGAL